MKKLVVLTAALSAATACAMEHFAACPQHALASSCITIDIVTPPAAASQIQRPLPIPAVLHKSASEHVALSMPSPDETNTAEKKLTFLLIKHILKAVGQTTQELYRSHGLVVEHSSDHGSANHFFGHTSQGLKLFCNPYPHSLATPWGAVGICGTVVSGNPDLLKYYLLKRIRTQTRWQQLSDPVKKIFHYVLHSNVVATPKKSGLLDEGVPILAVDGIPCPPVVEFTKETYVSHNELEDDWEELENDYEAVRLCSAAD